MELEEALVAAGAERVNVPSLLAPEVQSNEKIAFGTDESGSPAERERCAPRRGLATRMPFLSDTPSAVLPGPALACRSPRLWESGTCVAVRGRVPLFGLRPGGSV